MKYSLDDKLSEVIAKGYEISIRSISASLDTDGMIAVRLTKISFGKVNHYERVHNRKWAAKSSFGSEGMLVQEINQCMFGLEKE